MVGQQQLGQQQLGQRQQNTQQQQQFGQQQLGQPRFGQQQFDQYQFGQQNTQEQQFGQQNVYSAAVLQNPNCLGLNRDYYDKNVALIPVTNERLAIGFQRLTNSITSSTEFRTSLFELNTLVRQTLSANVVFAGKHDVIHRSTQPLRHEQQFTHPSQQPQAGATSQGQSHEFHEKAFLRLFDYDLDDQARLLLASQWQDFFRRAHSSQGIRTSLKKLMLLLERQSCLDNMPQDTQATTSSHPTQQSPYYLGWTPDSNLMQTLLNCKALVEAFAGVKLDKLHQVIVDLAHRARDDARFWEQLGILKWFCWHSLNDLQWVESPEFTDMAIAMINRFRLTMHRHGQMVSRVCLKSNFILESMRNKQAQGDGPQASIQKDIFYSDDNRLTLKPSFLDDFRHVLVPIVSEQLRYLRTPGVTGSDEAMDYEIENIIFQAAAIIPDKVRIDTMIIDPEGVLLPSSYHNATIAVQLVDMTVTLQDVKFAYRRKKFLKMMEERGMMDIVLGGQGITVDIELKPCTNGKKNCLFAIQRVRCESAKIEIQTINGEEHSSVYSILKPIIESRVRRAVEQAVEDCLCRVMEKVDYIMTAQHGWRISRDASAQLNQSNVDEPNLGQRTNIQSDMNRPDTGLTRAELMAKPPQSQLNQPSLAANSNKAVRDDYPL